MDNYFTGALKKEFTDKKTALLWKRNVNKVVSFEEAKENGISKWTLWYK